MIGDGTILSSTAIIGFSWVPEVFGYRLSIGPAESSFVSLVSGPNPNASQLNIDFGDPVVDVFSINDDQLSSFGSASRHSFSPCLPFPVEFQNASRQAVCVSDTMDLAVERELSTAFLIIPDTGFLKVDDGTVLPSATVVGFTRIPMTLRRRDPSTIGPGPFALMTSVSGSDPLQLF